MLTNQRSRKRMRVYYKRLEKGLCPQCGGNRKNGTILCETCLVKNRVKIARVPKELIKKYRRDYRKKNRKRGLCPYCGQVPEEGRVRCRKCLDYERDRKNRNYQPIIHITK